jgi:hypothetical protein
MGTRTDPVARRLRTASIASAVCAYLVAGLLALGSAESADNASTVIPFGNVALVWLLLVLAGVALSLTGVMKLLAALGRAVAWWRGPRPSPWPGVLCGVAVLGWALTVAYAVQVIE